MVIARMAAMLAGAAMVIGQAQAQTGPSIQAMIELTDLSSVAVSPDGRIVAYRAETASIERNGYDLAWYVVPVDGSAPPRRIAGAGTGDRYGGTLLSRPPIWSGDGQWIYYRAAIDDELQVWRARADGTRVEQVTHDAGDVTDFALHQTTGILVYAAGAAREDIARAEQQEYDRGIRIDKTVDPAAALFRGGEDHGRRATERLVGFWFQRGRLLADAPPHYQSVVLESGKARPATAEERATLRPMFRPFDKFDGRQILGQANAGDRSAIAYILADGMNAVLTVREADGKLRLCDAALCRNRMINWISWASDGSAILFQTRDASGRRLNRWDIATGTVEALVPVQDMENGGADDTTGCAATPRYAICVAAAANRAPQIESIELTTGKRRILVDPNAGLIDPGWPRFQTLSWRSADGTPFHGELMLPDRRSGPVPLFITYYVCNGFIRGGTGDEYPLRQMVDRGIAVLCINRAATRPGLGDQQAEYRTALGGIEAAADLLARRSLIDSRRIGMGGLSFGAEVTAWVLAHSDLLAAASLSSTLVTPTYYWFNAMPGRDAPAVLREVWKVGDPDEDLDGWRRLSPALNTATMRAPLLMQMAEQEYRFNIELAARLGAKGKAVDLWAFPDEQHVKVQPRHKLAVYERNLDWFCYWLLGAVDPSPAKRAQYALWQSFETKPGWRQAATAADGRPVQERTQASTSANASKP